MPISQILDKPPGYPGTGQPTKLSPTLQDLIVKYVSQGAYLETACKAAGISTSTFGNWLKWGQEEGEHEGGIYFAFLQAIQKADAEAELKLTSKVFDAGLEKGGWLPALSYAGRRWRSRWEQTPQQNTGATYNINVEKAIITAGEKFDQALERLGQGQGVAQTPELIAGSTPAVSEAPLQGGGDNATK